jgi:hypothetical protein
MWEVSMEGSHTFINEDFSLTSALPQNIPQLIHQFFPQKVTLLNPLKYDSLRFVSHCTFPKSVIVLVRLMAGVFLCLT